MNYKFEYKTDDEKNNIRGKEVEISKEGSKVVRDK